MTYIEMGFETVDDDVARIVHLARKLPFERIVRVSSVENGKHRDFAGADAADLLIAMHGWDCFPYEPLRTSDDTAGSLTVILAAPTYEEAITLVVDLCHTFASEILSDQVGLALLTEEEAARYVA